MADVKLKMSLTIQLREKRKVSVVGSGNFGSVIAKIMGRNVLEHPDLFEPTVHVQVHEEMVDGKKLTEIINTQHENVKYLKGHKFTDNVVAEPDIVKACADSDVIVFVVPHQFLKRVCQPLVGKIKKTAFGVSLIKGFNIDDDGNIQLFTELLNKLFGIEMCVLMGANVAEEIAMEQFSECTLGCHDRDEGIILKKLFQTPYFRICVVEDVKTIEACGALKNIVACAAGFSDGLGYEGNTKAAIIRLGLQEMISFVNQFYPGGQLITFLESCGVADLITTCFGGRNRKLCEALVKTQKSLAQLEKEILNGQKPQGPATAEEVYLALEKIGKLKSYPLFTVVHKICTGQAKPTELIAYLMNHPAHLDIPRKDRKPKGASSKDKLA